MICAVLAPPPGWLSPIWADAAWQALVDGIQVQEILRTAAPTDGVHHVDPPERGIATPENPDRGVFRSKETAVFNIAFRELIF